MSNHRTSNRRTIVVILTALVTLVLLVIATGGGLSTSQAPVPPPAPPAHVVTTVPSAAGPLKGHVQARVVKSGKDTYSFTYTVRNGGAHPIAGFQINGGRAALFHISGPAGWNRFGQGVCGGHYPNVLIYWSTGSNFIQPGHSARFAFDVRTKGTASLLVSLSTGPSVQFGHVPGPAPSSLSPTGSCH